MIKLIKRVAKKQIYLCVFFFTVGAFFYTLGLSVSKRKLIQDDKEQVVLALDEYLQKNVTSPVYNGEKAISVNNVEDIGRLSFVKITRNNEHIIFHHGGSSGLLLKNLVNTGHGDFDWISLDGKILTIIERRLNKDILIQAGVIATHQLTYQELKKYFSIIFCIYLIACPFCSLIIFRFCKTPLQQTIAGIGEIRKSRFNAKTLVMEGFSEEQNLLHKQINNLLEDNQNLLLEIQGSLDNLAHDLRTPVARMRSIAEYGLQENSKDGLADALVNCLEESEYIAKMLAVMMSVAEAESGTMRLNKSRQSLSTSILAAIELYEYVAEDKEIEVRFINKNDTNLNLDDIRIRQVWANLLDNGIKYGKIGGSIEITIWQEESLAYISFSDNGMGISEAEIPRIWERLYRGDRSRTEKGLGLGLNYVQAVVTAHGGNISVTSVLQQGSCFTVVLPVPSLDYIKNNENITIS
ncbi:MAG: HAMP domain-containing histidine kinase [Desulfotalea sp.]